MFSYLAYIIFILLSLSSKVLLKPILLYSFFVFASVKLIVNPFDIDVEFACSFFIAECFFSFSYPFSCFCLCISTANMCA